MNDESSKQALMGKSSGRKAGYVANPVPVVLCNAAVATVHTVGFLGFVGCFIAGSLMVGHSNDCKSGGRDVHTSWSCGDPFPEVMGPRFFGLAVLLAALPLARYCWAVRQAWVHYESHKRPYDPWRVINEYYTGLWELPEYVDEPDV